MTLPKIIDLFSGCGGLALGFDKAGFDINGGIELMPEAHKTITENLCWRHGREEETHICGDITKTDPGIFQDRYGDEGCIVIGGPPCQAYSLVGRAKLKSLGPDRANTADKRGYLFQDFVRFAIGLDARAVIMENVPESTNYGHVNIPQTVCSMLDSYGYHSFWTVLNSADFGVPQVRERVFVVAVRNDQNIDIDLPRPEYRNPTGNPTTYGRQLSTFAENRNFRMPYGPSGDEPYWVTVGEAFSDLPVLFPTADTKYRLTPMNIGLPYRTEITNTYQRKMRTWFGQETRIVTANAFRKTQRDYPIFAEMKQGDNYLAASEIADRHLKQAARVYNYLPGSEEYESLKKKIVPPYARDKFPDKWKKLSLDKPSHTLVAHLSVDTYSHIHPTEPRGISVREAARLQSFPDDFYFDCSMGDAYKQIGNAVPPLLSFAIAKQVFAAFTGKE